MTLGACAGNRLQAIETPAAGVQLEYALAPGSRFEGHVHHKQQEGATGGQQSTRRLDFDVSLTVGNTREDGAAHVQATISNIDLNWVVPNLPINPAAFVAESKKKLEGMKVDVFVSKTGELVDFPELPAEVTDEDRFLMEAVLDGLEQAFYVVPERALKKGETWKDESSKGRKGKLGRYYEVTANSTFDGLFTEPASDDGAERTVARISVNSTKIETITTKAGGHETKTIDKKSILFDTEGSYLAGVEGTRTKYDAGVPSTVKFRASWRQTGSGAAPVEAAPPAEAKPEPAPADPAPAPSTCAKGDENCEVQAGLDPCDDDYVGGEDCTDPCSSNYMGDEACEKKAE
jgi:hypothetical protein